MMSPLLTLGAHKYDPFLVRGYQIYSAGKILMEGEMLKEIILLRGPKVWSPCTIKTGLTEDAALGKDGYFAVDAIYLPNKTSSKPDANVKKWPYYVPVPAVDCILGNSSFIGPPPNETQDAHAIDDSVIDHVIFYNHQSYPESLISFRK